MPGLKVCGIQGCPNLTTSRWCQAHTQSAGHHLYDTARWKGKHGLRDRVRREEPFCSVPGCDRLTDHIDHVVPHRGDERLFFDRSNLSGICAVHHSEKTARGE